MANLTLLRGQLATLQPQWVPPAKKSIILTKSDSEREDQEIESIDRAPRSGPYTK